MKTTVGSLVRRLAAAALGLSAVLVLTAGRGEAADLKLSVEPSTAAAGGSGAFDVYLEVTGNGPVDVSAFSFGLSVAGSGIEFTGATDTPTGASYVFSSFSEGDRSFDATVTSATSLVVSDTVLAAPLFETLAAGAKVGLGRVSYSVASGTAAGDVAASFVLDNSQTVVYGQDGTTPLAFDATPGTITVTAPNVVPEPASLVLLGLAAAPVLAAGLRKRAA